MVTDSGHHCFRMSNDSRRSLELHPPEPAFPSDNYLMEIDRSSATKLGSFVGVAAVAGGCHYFGLRELPGLLGTGMAVAGAGAQAWVGNLGVDLVKNIAERPGEESPRDVQNRLSILKNQSASIVRGMKRQTPNLD